ncbi:MAG: metallophosphoesterase [Acidobacteria bacterium]|nr:metallophosphoesterase [Acidobacteriota bacterium]
MIEAKSGRFAVVGDLQRTSRAEFWRESNPEERRRLVAEIAARSPDFVVGLGDLVFQGSSRRDWEFFDALTQPLRAAGIPILPILGNHEYWLRSRIALRNFFERFPTLAGRRWYAETYGSLGLLFLDSNERELGREAWREQESWLGETLAALDADPAVRGVVVFVHHPPFTNSTVTGDELHVRRAFVPPFAAARKTLAMVAGHVHSYEHFVRGAKTFLVAGGGGGPRARLARGAARRHADDLFDGPELRHFHFLLGTPSISGLDVEVVGLEKRARECAPLARFTLPWAG